MTIKFNEKTEKWEFCFDVGRSPLTGKRKQIRRRGFATKGEAIDAFAKVKAEVLEGDFLDINTITYERFMDDYFEERKISLQRSTFETHSIYYQNCIKPRFGKLKLQDINNFHIQKFINELATKSEFSARTIHLIHRIMYSSFKKAKIRKIVKENPCENITLPKPPKREMNVWSLEQVNYFLREAPYVQRVTRCLIGFQLGLLAGLRQGEILGLRWKDVDFKNHLLYVRQVVTQKGEIRTGAKNDGSIRSISIPKRLIQELESHREQIEWEKARCRIPYCDNDLVLPTRDGSPMIPRNFRKEFYNLTERLDLPKIRFHDTRHTHATLLIAQNVNVKLIAERLGHTDIETTLNTYSHVIPNMQKPISDKLDEILDF